MSPSHKVGILTFSVCLLLAGCAALAARETFNVTLQVDFGPAGKTPIEKVVQVEPGATPEGVLEKACAIQRGAVCCNPRETAGIDGVAADPATNRWWTVSVNGSKKVSPYKTKLKPGDLVRWEYREYGQ